MTYTPKNPKYQTKIKRPHVFCAKCGVETQIYYMCDIQAAGAVAMKLCGDCFYTTDCGQGKHSEDCPTKVFCGGTQ